MASHRERTDRRAWLRRALTPHVGPTHLLVALLCAVLGFAAVAQIRQQGDDPVAGMRQADLVELIGELGTREDELTTEKEELAEHLAELEDAASDSEAARQAAQERADTQEILAGTVPVTGPGLTLTVQDPAGTVTAQTLYSVLQELRNAGAEAVELGGVRLGASSSITGEEGALRVDGTALTSPYRWQAIGDAAGMSTALGIPGGALAQLRSQGATATVTQEDDFTITTVREVSEPRWATTQADDD